MFDFLKRKKKHPEIQAYQDKLRSLDIQQLCLSLRPQYGRIEIKTGLYHLKDAIEKTHYVNVLFEKEDFKPISLLKDSQYISLSQFTAYNFTTYEQLEKDWIEFIKANEIFLERYERFLQKPHLTLPEQNKSRLLSLFYIQVKDWVDSLKPYWIKK